MTPLVQEARTWIGTPFVHQGRTKGAGCDCLGLVVGVLSAFGHEPEVPVYSDNPQLKDNALFYNGLISYLKVSREVPDVGQILGFSLRRNGPLAHIGILSQLGPIPRFIHAYSTYGVVESALTDAWQRRIVARFELPTGD